jgi:hypothetical protein
MESGTPGSAPEAPLAAGAVAETSAGVPQVRPGSGPPSAAYPAITEFDRQEEYNRFLPIVKSLLLIPHYIVLVFLMIGVFFAIVGSWFAVLFTGKLPQGIHKFLTGVFRWSTRVNAYAFLMTDKYPPFSLDADDAYPARFDAVYTEKIARWRPLLHWLLVIPYTIVAVILFFVAYIVTVLAFFAILFTKKFPAGMFDFNVVTFRWQNRNTYYSYWMTEKYPSWEWG